MQIEQTTETRGADRHQETVVHLHMTRRFYVGLVLLLAMPWVFLATYWVGKQAVQEFGKTSLFLSAAGRVSLGERGPWGSLRYTRMAIEPPEEFLFVEPVFETPPRWFFRDYGPTQIAEFFASAGLTSSDISKLAERTSYDAVNRTAIVNPPPDLVLGMSPETRSIIYGKLTAWPENYLHRFPFTLRPEFIEERFEESKLPPEIVADIKKMLYPWQHILLFADTNLILSRPIPKEIKLRTIKTLARRNTLQVNLHIDKNSDISQLVEYWGSGLRAKDLRPLLESLRRVPGGAWVDVAHLLPQFARRRLYTYPWASTDSLANRRDCHWTSLNFFSIEPDDRYTDPEEARKAMASNYYPIIRPTKLGDIALLMTAQSQVLHSAVYVADDIFFTKNGATPVEPWRFMQLDDMTAYFSAFYQQEGKLNVMFFRRKQE